jgi:hypothetical protein
VTPQQQERIVQLQAGGYSVRDAADVLKAEGIALGKSAVGDEYRRIRLGHPSTAAHPTYRAPAPQPQRQPKELEPLPPVDEGELLERDPARLAERDWHWYEAEVLSVRALARHMLAQREFKHYNDLLAKAEKLERRAKELRPPAPPNPDSDPTYRAEARRLVSYLDALVSAAETNAPLPERTLPPTVAIAA